MYEAQKAGKEFKPPSLGDIVMVDSVKEARSRKVLNSMRPFEHFTEDSIAWSDGHEEKIDAIIFCTGFKPALKHLAGLGALGREGRPDTEGTKSKLVNGLWLVGYGNWTGFASATLIGVGRSAKKTVEQIQEFIGQLIPR
jgi:putative flavoprotein involved in K+ transport